MYKKRIISILLFILIVSTVNGVELIERDIGNYEFEVVELPEGVAMRTSIEGDYRIKETNSVYQVIILPGNVSAFDEKHRNNKKEYSNGTVYIEDSGNNLFWINQNKVIIISSALGTQFQFPDEIVEEYLKTYPNEVEDLSVPITKDAINIGLNWFKQPHPEIKKSNYYTDRLVYCRNDYEKLRIEFNFSDDEILAIKNHCEYNQYFRITGATIPTNVKMCGENLSFYLIKNNVEIIDPDMILDECLLREQFEIIFSQKGSDFIDSVFLERNIIIFNEATYIKTEVLADEVTEIYDTKNRTIRNIPIDKKINNSYYRNESLDIVNIENKIDSEKRIELNRSEKAELDLETDTDKLNFRGLINKILDFLPWFKK